MHPNPKRVLPVVLVVALLGAGYWYFLGGGRATPNGGALTLSGTIEATLININPELGGRVTAVNVAEGDPVTLGATLIQLDSTVLEAQRTQAAAAVTAAEGAHAAAQANLKAATAAAEAAAANYALLQAGPSTEQLAVSQTLVDKAQLAVDALQTQYADLSEAAQDSANGIALKNQLDQAQASLDNAQAQYDLLASGARPEQLAVAEAQLHAAQAQAEAAQAQVSATQGQIDTARAAVGVLDAQLAKLTLTAPAEGIILSRAIEPGEVALPGSALLTVANLADLTITVYAPENLYGNITLGQAARVTVDSFPSETFAATVIHIADKFEFTPRNVQTVAGRQTTVFAIQLRLTNTDGRLKPGMPADVSFGD